MVHGPTAEFGRNPLLRVWVQLIEIIDADGFVVAHPEHGFVIQDHTTREDSGSTIVDYADLKTELLNGNLGFLDSTIHAGVDALVWAIAEFEETYSPTMQALTVARAVGEMQQAQ